MKLQPNYENQVHQKFSIQSISCKGDTFSEIMPLLKHIFSEYAIYGLDKLKIIKKVQNKDWLK